jgi:hypothetical protein
MVSKETVTLRFFGFSWLREGNEKDNRKKSEKKISNTMPDGSSTNRAG